MGHLLVIAPRGDLQQSLRFALEAAGHAVTTHASIGEVSEPANSFDCVILDHHGAQGRPRDIDAFYATFGPVVLLANELGHPLSRRSYRTILKPLLGPLSLAVSEAIAAAPSLRDTLTMGSTRQDS